IAELVGFVHGVTSAAAFRELGTKIWDDNANNPGTEDKPNAWVRSKFREGEDDLGRIYGAQWRDWAVAHFFPTGSKVSPDDYESFEFADTLERGPGHYAEMRVDQLQNLIQGLVDDPFGRRHIVSAWNPGELH